MRTKTIDVDVVTAAERRVLESFNKHKYISMSFSGGKDSICMGDIVIKTMQKYNIDFSRLIVVFYDEEGIYPDFEQIVLEWRSLFLSLGAKFYWFCLPIKHYNCCNRLENDESFICWEPGKEDLWIRPMPKFAIRHHKDFYPGMTYQVFSKNLFQDIYQMVGLRVYESVQRRQSIAGQSKSKFLYPIYDWRDNDVWLYIERNNLKFPETYLYLYKTGVPVNKLRISQFFSIDTIKTLPKVLEFYPNLFEKIVRREPNADLVMLYWETDMFRSSRQDDTFNIEKDYRITLREELKKASQHPDQYPGYKQVKKLFARVTPKTTSDTCRRIYQILIAGDPKNRTVRVVTGKLLEDSKDYPDEAR